MDRTLIVNWNSLVRQEDTIYVLGDFGFGNVEFLQRIFNRLNGHKHLIQGNHDKNTILVKGWESITEYHGSKVIHIPHPAMPRGKQMIVMSHFAYAVWDKSHHGAINLYGHSHGMPPDRLRPNNQQLDVGVDAWDCFPCNLEMIMRRLHTLPPYRSTDHHQEYKSIED